MKILPVEESRYRHHHFLPPSIRYLPQGCNASLRNLPKILLAPAWRDSDVPEIEQIPYDNI